LAPTPDAAVVFEAATVKQNKSGADAAGIRRFPGGRFEATNISLSALITFAYQLQPFELQGGPPWLTSDRWDVLAKTTGDSTADTAGDGRRPHAGHANAARRAVPTRRQPGDA
jgi:uncharacterized protein (TIGR03435 family)